MNLKILQIVTNELLQQKIKSETSLEFFLMENELEPKQKISNIIDEINNLKEASLRISFWEDFIDKNIITQPEMDDNKEKK